MKHGNIQDELTLQDYLTSSNKYPQRAVSKEITGKTIENALDLNKRINALLKELGMFARYSSGFRPSYINSNLKNAAKKSTHKTGNAGDLETQKIAIILKTDFDKNKEKSLLVKHDLYIEHPLCTPSWTHLQRIPPRSGARVYRCGICEKCKKI